MKLLLKTFLRRASPKAEMAGDRAVSMTKHKHMQVYAKQCRFLSTLEAAEEPDHGLFFRSWGEKGNTNRWRGK